MEDKRKAGFVNYELHFRKLFPLKIRFLIFCFFPFCLQAQTLGGQAIFNFANYPSSPVVTALGGVNISYSSNDVSLSANNPALLKKELDRQLNLSFSSFPGAIRSYSFTGARNLEQTGAQVGAHLHYFDYGMIPFTDAAGNINGEFRPTEFVAQVSASKNYLERWRYGGSLKFLNASYGGYRSNALAVDVGVLYKDEANELTLSLVAKNMGFQLKTFAGEAEDLPFDLQLGFSKRLSKSPFGFSITARQLQGFNLFYRDTLFNNDNNVQQSNSFFNKALDHLVTGMHIYLGKNIEAMIGYNHLRGRELAAGTDGNGLTGFSGGVHLLFNKLNVQYSYAAYQVGVGYHQLGISLKLDKLTGLSED